MIRKIINFIKKRNKEFQNIQRIKKELRTWNWVNFNI